MPRNESIQSVQRAIRILYAVAGTEDGRSIGQIAAAVGLKSNTVYKFVRTLEAEHFLVRKENPLRFSIGRAMTELKRLDDDRHLLTVAAKVLMKVHTKMPSGSFGLMEHQSGDTYVRLNIESKRPGVLVRPRERRFHPYGKASSLVFLAYAPQEDYDQFFRIHPFEVEGKSIWKTRERLEACLSKIRRLGYAQAEFISVQDWRGIAVPVFSSGKELVAVVAGYYDINMPVDSCKTLFRLSFEAAKEISSRL